MEMDDFRYEDSTLASTAAIQNNAGEQMQALIFGEVLQRTYVWE